MRRKDYREHMVSRNYKTNQQITHAILRVVEDAVTTKRSNTREINSLKS